MSVPDKPFNFIHKITPFDVQIIDISKNENHVIEHDNKLWCNGDLRGGSNLLRLDDGGYFTIVHRRKGAFYVNNFFVFDENLKLKHFSNNFNFDNIYRNCTTFQSP